MDKEINIIFIEEIQSWVHNVSGPDENGKYRGVVISKVKDMSIKEQKDFFLDKVLENDEKAEIYKAILYELTKDND